jgi:hypothetical protein
VNIKNQMLGLVGIGLLTIALVGGRAVTAQDSAGVVIENPLAYVGADGNVYIADAATGESTALTTDAFYERRPDTGDLYLQYQISSWSPDGQTLTLAQSLNTLAENRESLYLVPSGGGEWGIISVDYLSSPNTAWSPDGTQIALFGSIGEVRGLLTVPVTGGDPTFISNVAASIGEGPGPEPAAFLAAAENGYSPLSEAYYVKWLEQGIFFGTYYEGSCFGPVIATAPVEFLCSDWFAYPPFAISPDGTRIVAQILDAPVPIELSFTPNESAFSPDFPTLPLPEGATPLGWSADGTALYYSTISDTEIVSSDWRLDDGYPEFSESTLMIWQSALDGSPDLKTYETRGYGIGKMTISADPTLPIVVSIVTSDLPAATAFNNGAPAEDVELIRSHVEILALQPGVENSEPLWVLQGGQPLYGTGPFVVAP